MIAAGQLVPDLALTDTDGVSYRLRELYDEGAVLIYFMRHIGCPVCNRHVQRLAASAARFTERGVTVLVAVPEDADTAARWASQKRLPFAVVRGTGRSPHETMGLTRKLFGSMQQSGTVLIARGGEIRYLEVATVPTGGYSPRAADEAVVALEASAR